MFIDLGTAIIALAVLLAVVIFIQCMKNIVFAKKLRKLKKEQEVREKYLYESIKSVSVDVNKNSDFVDNMKKEMNKSDAELKSGLSALRVRVENNERKMLLLEGKINECTATIERLEQKHSRENGEINNKIIEQQANALTLTKEQNEKIQILDNENKKLTERQATEKAEIELRLSELEQSLLAKIQEQFEKISSIEEENKELERKLEIFTEIDSDSMRLNAEEDERAKEDLIARALKEFSEDISKQSVSKKEETEAVEAEHQEEETRNNDLTSDCFENNISSEECLVEEATENQLFIEENDEQEIIAEKEDIQDFSTVNQQKEELVSQNSSGILDDGQRRAYHLMETTNDNCFITGKAGTGKSFLLQMFEKGTKKKILKLAPTGVAALHIGGVTIHSAFGYYNLNTDIDDLNEATLKLKQQKKELLKNLDTIIIDEVSMVRADTLEKIDKILQIINKTSLPFGGKQMLLFGDVFQLPPIANKEEIHYLNDKYGGAHFFNSNSYKDGKFSFVELVTNHRQKGDSVFFEILNRIREGKVTREDIAKINERYFQGDTRDLRRIVRLYPKKEDAEEINSKELDAIPAKEYTFAHVEVFNETGNQNFKLENNFQISSELKLKVGAVVMMTRNDINKRWVNGTLAIVSKIKSEKVDIELDSELHSATPIEVTISGRKYDVFPCEWEQKDAEYKDGKIKYKTVYKTYQYPMLLAYAITIHKSQGMTYPNVACAPGKSFAPGQAYVALSRCESLNGLYLLDKLTSEEIKVDSRVSEFYLSAKKEH